MTGYKHAEGEFQGKNDTRIYFQSWKPLKPKASVIIVHGVGEHSGRYMNLINKMDGKSISFYAADHRGHGKSGGKKGHTDFFMDYIHDLKLLVNIVKNENSGLPVFLLGHSMGGTIACRYALTYQDDLSGLVLSGAGVKPIINKSDFFISAAKGISGLLPRLSISNGLIVEDLTHDEEVIRDYRADKLNHDRVTLRFSVEFLKNGEECINRAEELTLPLLLIHGGQDRICDVKGSQLIYERSSSIDKQIEIFEGLFHETMNEEGKMKETPLNTVSKWITSMISKVKAAAATPATAPVVEKKEPVVQQASPAVKKPAAKKPAAKKAAAKKPAAKKPAAKKPAAKKPAAKKPAAKKPAAKKPAAKKPAAKKPAAKKPAAKKPAAKKPAAKKAVKK
ncbi:MAG: lysophospholipase [Spirochaetes bacterium]|nr:lysophospholipase [Spirochaetota bacterium]